MRAVIGPLLALTLCTACLPFSATQQVNGIAPPGVFSPSRSTLSLSSSTLATGQVAAGSSIFVNLTARDQNGALFVETGANVVFTATGGTSTGQWGEVIEGLNGVYGTRFTGIQVGTEITVTATFDGQPLTTAPVKITVLPGSGSASLSSVTLNSASVNADGTTDATLSIALVDAEHNVVPGKAIQVTSNRAAVDTVTAVNATTDAGGLASFTVHSSTVGVATLTAIDVTDATKLQTKPTLSFINSGVVAGNSSISGIGPVVADGTAVSTVTVTLRDANHNPVASVRPSFAATDTGGSNGYGTCSYTDAGGQSMCTLSSRHAEVKTLSITGPVSLTGGTVTFKAGPAAKLAFTQYSSTTATAGQNFATSPIVSITDTNGNPILPADAAASDAVTLSAFITADCSTTAGSGAFTRGSVSAISGLATFTNVQYSTAQTIYVKASDSTRSLGTVCSGAGHTVVVGSALTSFNADWPMNAAAASSTYSYNASSIDFTGGVAELTKAAQTDASSNCTTGFGDGVTSSCGGTYAGSVIYDAGNSEVRLSATPPILDLDASWTPAWNQLVGYWKLENNLVNAIGGSTETPVGSGVTFSNTTYRIGGYSGEFGGSGAIGISTLLPASYTKMAWVNISATGDVNNIISGSGVGTDTAFWFSGSSYGCGGSASLRLAAGHSGSYGQVCDTTDVETNHWYHVAVTYDSVSHAMALYRDGRLVGTGSSPVVPTGAGLQIGAYAASNYFLGHIDDAAIWSTALTADAINTIYQHQNSKFAGTFVSRVIDGLAPGQSWQSLSWSPTLPFFKTLPDAGLSESNSAAAYPSLFSSSLMTGILGLWHLDEAAGTTGASSVIDHSGNGVHGTPGTGVTFGVKGKLGSAAVFDGTTNGFITLAAPVTTALDTVTIAAWVNLSSLSSSGSFVKLGGAHSGYGLGVGSANFEVAGNHLIAIYESIRWIDTGVSIGTGWHHVALSISPAGLPTMFLDGKQIYTDTGLPPSPAPTGAQTIGGYDTTGSGGSTRFFTGAIDEVAIWGRVLDPVEVLQLYRRGANRLQYQVRSCTEATCTTGSPAWQGPDGSDQSYFTELNNTASNASGGAVATGLPAMGFGNFGSVSIASNRYFQYRTVMESDDANALCDYGAGATACSPELKNVSIGPDHYDSSIPTVINQAAVNYVDLTSFSETLGSNGCGGGSRYQLSVDGSNWFYWSGAAWVTADNTTHVTGYANANSAAALTPSVMTAFSTQTGASTGYFKAFLKSDGTQACEIDDLSIGGHH